MAEVKITQKMQFEDIMAIVAGADIDEARRADALAFVEKKIAQIDAKAEKAREKAAEAKAEGDKLRAAVEAVLTGEAQLIADITAQVEGEEVTRAKVTSRLTQLVKAGVAEKETVTVDGKKLAAYKLV